MNILIVEDQPKLKVEPALDYLKSEKVKFDYTICSSVHSALRYIQDNLSKVDLAIIDLGLPFFDGEPVKGKIEGMDIVFEISDKNYEDNLNIPIIINSTTKIEGVNGETEEEYFKAYFGEEFKKKIEHVDCLEGPWLYEFLQNNMAEKVEFI